MGDGGPKKPVAPTVSVKACVPAVRLTVALLLRTMMMIASLPGAFFISGIMAGDESGSPELGQAGSETDSPV